MKTKVCAGCSEPFAGLKRSNPGACDLARVYASHFRSGRPCPVSSGAISPRKRGSFSKRLDGRGPVDPSQCHSTVDSGAAETNLTLCFGRRQPRLDEFQGSHDLVAVDRLLARALALGLRRVTLENLSRCAWSGQRMRAVIPSFDRI